MDMQVWCCWNWGWNRGLTNTQATKTHWHLETKWCGGFWVWKREQKTEPWHPVTPCFWRLVTWATGVQRQKKKGCLVREQSKQKQGSWEGRCRRGVDGGCLWKMPLMRNTNPEKPSVSGVWKSSLPDAGSHFVINLAKTSLPEIWHVQQCAGIRFFPPLLLLLLLNPLPCILLIHWEEETLSFKGWAETEEDRSLSPTPVPFLFIPTSPAFQFRNTPKLIFVVVLKWILLFGACPVHCRFQYLSLLLYATDASVQAHWTKAGYAYNSLKKFCFARSCLMDAHLLFYILVKIHTKRSCYNHMRNKPITNVF